VIADAHVALTEDDQAAPPSEIIDQLRAASRVLAVCHQDPEADALGSMLALAQALEILGKQATPVCSDPPPAMYDFMPGIERFRIDPDPAIDYDLIVVGDCGELARVGRVAEQHAELFGRLPIVDIDHHASNRGFGTVDWIDPSAAATCEMITLLLPRLGVRLDELGGAIATNLMAGVVIDTATFQHPNTTPRTLRVGSELLAAGAPLSDISRRLYRTKPNSQLRLFGLVLARLRSTEDGSVVWSRLNDDDLRESGATPEMSEGLIDLLAQSGTADVAILFKDQGARTRMSIRTRDGGVDAIELSGRFGGGGHARAAGATILQPADEAIPVVLDAAMGLARQLTVAGSPAPGDRRDV
jgi:phosphoesterase RecJ-like protein